MHEQEDTACTLQLILHHGKEILGTTLQEETKMQSLSWVWQHTAVLSATLWMLRQEDCHGLENGETLGRGREGENISSLKSKNLNFAGSCISI